MKSTQAIDGYSWSVRETLEHSMRIISFAVISRRCTIPHKPGTL
jgi:hypothetical protein